jgi:predicted GNAT superfamily acetyltransferase
MAEAKADLNAARATVEVRHCDTLAEYEECLRLQDITWSEGILVPTAIFIVGRETGGQVLGAFADGKMIGFTMALVGVHEGKPFLHSHMTAVLEEYRDRGVGRALKLFQRKDALARGMNLVEWTFDPLELRNAHFNFERLGAVARRFIPNCYGITESPLHSGMPTDRFMAEWWLDSPRVKRLLGESGGAVAGPAPEISKDSVRIAIPKMIGALRHEDRAAAEKIQTEVREQFLKGFANNYVATHVLTSGDKTEYVLEPAAEVAADVFGK